MTPKKSNWHLLFWLLCAIMAAQVAFGVAVLVLFAAGRTTLDETLSLGGLLSGSLIGEIALIILYHLLRDKKGQEQPPPNP